MQSECLLNIIIVLHSSVSPCHVTALAQSARSGGRPMGSPILYMIDHDTVKAMNIRSIKNHSAIIWASRKIKPDRYYTSL